MAVNYFSPVAITLALLPRMLERGTGTIVNVSSLGGRLGIVNEAAYSASKFALAGWSESLAADLLGSGVSVRLVLPGAIDTEIWDQPDNDPPDYDGPSGAGRGGRSRHRRRHRERAVRALPPRHARGGGDEDEGLRRLPRRHACDGGRVELASGSGADRLEARRSAPRRPRAQAGSGSILPPVRAHDPTTREVGLETGDHPGHEGRAERRTLGHRDRLHRQARTRRRPPASRGPTGSRHRSRRSGWRCAPERSTMRRMTKPLASWAPRSSASGPWVMSSPCTLARSIGSWKGVRSPRR